MADAPIFAATPRAATAPVATANTNRDGTGTIATVFSAGASGSKVEEIRVKADADPADSIVVIYLHDGTNYAVYDEFDLGNPAAGSATVLDLQREPRVREPVPALRLVGTRLDHGRAHRR